MCGICGKWSIAGVSRDSLETMADEIYHRGPDEDGYFLDGNIGLASRRLSIIDLSTGKQPISNEAENIWIVFNGEIYNFPELRSDLIERGHQFRTHSDTEVVVHMYEEYELDFVKKLRGMFAFALWDMPKRRLILARDPLGQKPLYYNYRPDKLSFASEIKSLLKEGDISARLNPKAMHNFISLRYIPEMDTMYAGIEKLPAGHILIFENGEIKIQSYWDVTYLPKLSGSEDELIAELHQLLLETVKSHMLSDVPLGAFLSGGLDSTLIASMMATLSDASIKTFSIGSQDENFNELPYARLVAERYRTEHYDDILEPNVVTSLPKMIWHMEEPVDPFAFGVFSVAQLASRHVKVVLGGDGGDEIFAGYDRYLGTQLVDMYFMLPPFLRGKIIEPIIKRLPDNYGYNNRVQKLRWMVAMSATGPGERYAQSATYLRFSHAHKQALFTEDLWRQVGKWNSLDYLINLFDSDNAAHLTDKMLYTDVKTRLADHLLMVNDRMTMAHSVEGRSPLVDQRVVEFVARIPAELKLRGRKLKYIQRQIAKGYLPETLLTRSKQGFSFPIARWFKGDLKDLMINLIQKSRMVSDGFFQRPAMLNMLEEHASGKVDHNYRLWLLLNLELWYRMFIDGQTIDELNDLLQQSMRAEITTRNNHSSESVNLGTAAPVSRNH